LSFLKKKIVLHTVSFNFHAGLSYLKCLIYAWYICYEWFMADFLNIPFGKIYLLYLIYG
jgi:hypothetical protein